MAEFRKLIKIVDSLKPAGKPLLYALAYLVWFQLYKLVALTLVTYLMVSSEAQFHEIADFFDAYEIPLFALSSYLFLQFLRALRPLKRPAQEELASRYRLQNRYFPGLIHGMVLAFGFTFALFLSEQYRYLGFFVQFDEAPLALGTLLLRTGSLCVMIYCEEYVFRQKILTPLRVAYGDITAIFLTAFLYAAFKDHQFDLGTQMTLSLFWISLGLGVRSVMEGDFTRAAGVWTGLLVFFHSGFSLPVFGDEFQGLVMFKYEAQSSSHFMSRILTGGNGGPLASLALLFIWMLDVLPALRTIIKNRVWPLSFK